MIRVDIDGVGKAMQEVAEQEILPYFGRLRQGDIAYKEADDPVTIADKNAESALSARLLDLLPGSKVVGEEAFASNRAVLEHFSGESPVWIIDPIDGTRNFVRSSSDFGVLVALTERNQTVAGWIYHPTSKEMVTVEKGSGAYYKGRKLKLGSFPAFPDMQGVLGDRLIEQYEQRRDSAAAEPEFTLMSAGAVEYPGLVMDDGYFGISRPQIHFRASFVHSTPWDDAAGVLMYREAGGYAAHWNGEPYAPSGLHKGLALAPDRERWDELKAWCSTFANLPTDA